VLDESDFPLVVHIRVESNTRSASATVTSVPPPSTTEFHEAAAQYTPPQSRTTEHLQLLPGANVEIAWSQDWGSLLSRSIADAGLTLDDEGRRFQVINSFGELYSLRDPAVDAPEIIEFPLSLRIGRVIASTTVPQGRAILGAAAATTGRTTVPASDVPRFVRFRGDLPHSIASLNALRSGIITHQPVAIVEIAWSQDWGSLLSRNIADAGLTLDDEGRRFQIINSRGELYSLRDPAADAPERSEFPLAILIGGVSDSTTVPQGRVNLVGAGDHSVASEAAPAYGGRTNSPLDESAGGPDPSLSVTQDVVHEEPAADISAQEAEIITRHVEAGYVELNLFNGGSWSHSTHSSDDEGQNMDRFDRLGVISNCDTGYDAETEAEWNRLSDIKDDAGDEEESEAEEGHASDIHVGEERHILWERILLLNFTRHPASFEKALQSRDIDAIREKRETLQRANLSDVLPCGTKILVSPEQYAMAKRAVVGKKLGPSHVICPESLEPVVRAAVDANTKHRENVRVKESDTEMLAYTDDHHGGVVVHKTFLDWRDSCALDRRSVSNSTTAVHGYLNLNPRSRSWQEMET